MTPPSTAGTPARTPGVSTPATLAQLRALGVKCPESGGSAAIPEIAKSFEGKVTYDQNKRGTISGNTIYLDCSSFALQVYKCAGFTPSGTYSGNIFTGSQVQNIPPGDITKLGLGDLLGWMPGEDPKGPNGHVVIYIGGGQIIDLQRSGVQERTLASMQDRYKYIKQLFAGNPFE